MNITAKIGAFCKNAVSRVKSAACSAKTAVVAVVTAIAVLGTANVASATGLDAQAATDGITAAVGFGTTVIAAGFAIGVLFMIARVIRRGMRSAG